MIAIFLCCYISILLCFMITILLRSHLTLFLCFLQLTALVTAVVIHGTGTTA